MSSLFANITVRNGTFVISGSIRVETSAVLFARNGSGKTTFLKGVAGLLQSEGQVLLGERDVSKLSPDKRGISYVPNDPKLPLSLSKLSQLLNVDVEELKDLGYDIDPRRPITSLSLGQRQVSFVLSVIKSPRTKAVLLDESLNNVSNKDTVLTFVLKLARDLGKPVVYSTNDPNDVRLFEKTFTISEGKVCEFRSNLHL